MSALDPQVFQDAAGFLAGRKRALLVAHEKPDGDALGALAAMRSLLTGLGVQAIPLLYEALPVRYSYFGGYGLFPVLGSELTTAELAGFDLVVVLDTCSYSQLRPIEGWLRSTRAAKLAVDHHSTRDALADHYLVEESAAATCLILHDWARAMGWAMDPVAAEGLFVGIATDTGWFRHSNTDERVLRACADLTARGVRGHEFYEVLHQRESAGRVRLLGEAIGSLELLHEGRLAVMSLDSAAFVRAGASPAETEDVINEPMRIASVVVSVLLVDAGDGVVRVSLRSREPRSGTDGDTGLDLDVAALAQGLGGGGHRRASGVRVKGALAGVRKDVLERLGKVLAA